MYKRTARTLGILIWWRYFVPARTPDEFFPKDELEKLALNINIIVVKNLIME